MPAPQNPTAVARPASAAFTWNPSAWFGGLLGSTAWMLVLAVLIRGGQSQGVASIVCLSCFLVGFVCGLALWKRRMLLAPYVGIQLQLVVTGTAGLVAWTGTCLFEPELPSAFGVTPWHGYAALLVVPMVGVCFWWKESAAQRRRFASRNLT